MKDLMCGYEELNGVVTGLSEQISQNSENKYIKKLLLDSRKTGSITDISFIKGFSEREISLINRTFGDVYKENKESYLIIIDEDIKVYSESINGFIYATAMIKRKSFGELKKGIIYNYPLCEVRGVKVFLPAEEELDFLKEYAEFCTYYGLNTIMIEVGGGMEYKKHPEINSGWEELCKDVTSYSGRCFELMTSREYYKNVFHPDVGGYHFVRQDKVRELCKELKELGLNVIPEIPSLSHSDYLLYNHRELAERQDDLYPDTYCPSNENSYKLLFDVIDEVIDVFQPKEINISHDELHSVCVCEKCKDKNAAELYANDIKRIYNKLKENGIRTLMWGDKLLNGYTKNGNAEGGALRPMKHYVTGKWSGLFIPPTYTAIDMIPSDIKIVHWFWNINRNLENDFLSRGMEVIFGNFDPKGIPEFKKRIENGVGGAITSSWGAVDAVHMQRNSMYYNAAFIGALMWDRVVDNEEKFKESSLRIINDINNYRNEKIKSYIEVLHSYNEYIGHKFFGDGERMDFDDDYIGKYIITYENGEVLEVPVYFGLQIGFLKASWERSESGELDCLEVKGPGLFETTYTCGYETDGDNIYYRYRIPVKENENIASVEFECRKDRQEKFIIKSIKIHNQIKG